MWQWLECLSASHGFGDPGKADLCLSGQAESGHLSGDKNIIHKYWGSTLFITLFAFIIFLNWILLQNICQHKIAEKPAPQANYLLLHWFWAMYRSGTIHVSTTKSKTGWSELSGTIHVSKKNPQFVDRDGQALFIFPQKNLKLVYWNFQAMGGFPSPEITWWIGTRRLKPEKTVIVIFCNE